MNLFKIILIVLNSFAFGNVIDFKPGSIEDQRFGRGSSLNKGTLPKSLNEGLPCSTIFYDKIDFKGKSFFMEKSALIPNVDSFEIDIHSFIARGVKSIAFYEGLSFSGEFIKFTKKELKSRNLKEKKNFKIKSVKITC